MLLCIYVAFHSMRTAMSSDRDILLSVHRHQRYSLASTPCLEPALPPRRCLALVLAGLASIVGCALVAAPHVAHFLSSAPPVALPRAATTWPARGHRTTPSVPNFKAGASHPVHGSENDLRRASRGPLAPQTRFAATMTPAVTRSFLAVAAAVAGAVGCALAAVWRATRRAPRATPRLAPQIMSMAAVSGSGDEAEAGQSGPGTVAGASAKGGAGAVDGAERATGAPGENGIPPPRDGDYVDMFCRGVNELMKRSVIKSVRDRVEVCIRWWRCGGVVEGCVEVCVGQWLCGCGCRAKVVWRFV